MGEASACACPDGSSGQATCDDSGQYGACSCADDGGSGAASSTSATGGASAASAGSGGGGAPTSSGTAGGHAEGGASPGGPWAHFYAAPVVATSIAVDSTGAVIVGGYHEGDLTVGGSTVMCPAPMGKECVFVFKLTSAGDAVWIKSFPVTSPSSFVSPLVAVGPTDEVLVAGAFIGRGEVDFGTGPVTGKGVFVTSFDPSGNLVWARSFSSSARATVGGLAVDALGRTVMSGCAPPGLDFGTGPLANGYAVQFDPMGAVRWARDGGGTEPGSGMGSMATTLSTGDAVVVSFTVTTGAVVDVGCGPLSLAPGQDAYLARFDGDTGACVFSRTLGELEPASSLVITSDPGDDDLVIGGELYGTVDAGTSTLASTQTSGAFVLRMDGNGQPLWGLAFPATDSDDVGGVAVNPVTHDIGLTGYANAEVDLGGGPITTIGGVFVSVLSRAGALISADRYGDQNLAAGEGIAFSPDGASLAIMGSFSGMMAFGPNLASQADPGTFPVFVAELPAPPRSDCTGDLSNVGAGDFHVTFDVATTQQDGQVAIANQRAACAEGTFWDAHLASGAIEVETDDDGGAYTALVGTRVIDDGASHHVEIARVAGSLTLTIDGVLDGTALSAASLPALAPLAARTDVCEGANGSVSLIGALTNLCVTSP